MFGELSKIALKEMARNYFRQKFFGKTLKKDTDSDERYQG